MWKSGDNSIEHVQSHLTPLFLNRPLCHTIVLYDEKSGELAQSTSDGNEYIAIDLDTQPEELFPGMTPGFRGSISMNLVGSLIPQTSFC